ncbi:MAG: ankyrin repeat domain-containing protein, partial [Gemmatimonadota bacterium]
MPGIIERSSSHPTSHGDGAEASRPSRGAWRRGRLRSSALGLAALALAWGVTSSSEAPVADAAARNDLAEVEALIRGGGEVDAAQGDGMTALHWAARHGNVELADLLLSADASIEPTTRLGAYTPLHMAA